MAETETSKKKKKVSIKKPSPLSFISNIVKKSVKRAVTDLSGNPKKNKRGEGIIQFIPKKVKQDSKTGKLATGGTGNKIGEGVKRKTKRLPNPNTKIGSGKGQTKVLKVKQIGTVKPKPKTIAKGKSQVRKRELRKALTKGGILAGTGLAIYKGTEALTKKPPMAATDSSSSGGSYKIESGDTLSQIAKRRGTTLKALLAANPSIKNANKIRVGQTIKISKPVKKRKSVYQGLSKSRMSKMAMPKKKKMYGGKVVKRDMGGSIGSMDNSKQDMRKERKRKMTAAAKSKYGSSYKGKVKKAIDKVINKKSARTRNETVNKAERMIKNNPKMFSGRPSSILTEEGFEKVNKKRMGGGKVIKRGKGGSVGSNLVAGCYDT